MRLGYQISIVISKCCAKATRLFNLGSGTSLPGKLALRLNPDILRYLISQTRNEIISVTGTNGKTTTSGFISRILKANGSKIAHNRKGANMLEGITTAIIESSNCFAKLDVDYSLLEADEAYLAKAVDHFNPALLLVTNLFRDQLDRYGELDTTAKKIQQAIDKTVLKKPLKLILNADDPMVSRLGNKQTEIIYFGFDDIKFVNQEEKIKTPQEIANCKCGNKIDYSNVFYGHLGHYHCNCGKKRPETQISARAEIFPAGSKLIINSAKTGEFEVNIAMPGVYNAYNALAAVSVGIELNIPVEHIKKGMEEYNTVFGRAELIELRGKQTLIQLIKNPIGATEVLRTVKDDENSRILIIINDNYADGRDVSWLWDANFELLKNHDKKIITSGIRAEDMAVRLKYAGIPQENIEIISDIEDAIRQAVEYTQEGQKLYILPTYTALLNMQKILKKF